jgi:hypothetical protein
MNTVRDPDAIIFAWLDDGPTDLPPETRNAIVIGARVVRQRRPMWLSRRNPRMSQPFRLATMAAALAVVVAVAFIAFRPALSPGPPQTSPSANPTSGPSSSPAPSRSSLPPAAEWVPFTSPFYGYTIRHPAGWDIIPATQHYGLPESPNLFPQLDKLDSPDYSLTVAGMRLRDGETSEAWLRAYFGDTIESGDACTPARSEWDAGTIDGQPAFLVRTCAPAVDTFVFAGDRVYIFTAWAGLVDDRPLFETFLSTIRLQPASAVDPTPTP